MERSSLDTCRFRHSVRRRGQAEEAVCGWLQAATGLRGSSRCRVARDACLACLDVGLPTPRSVNPVVASMLYRICDEIVAQGGAPGCSAEAATRLRELGEVMLASCQVEPSSLWGCDVVVCCADSAPPTERAIRSALEQDGAIPIVHLVDDGGGGAPLIAQYARRWNVVIHRNPAPRGLFATLHELLPELRTEFVAVQEAGTISHRDRLATSVAALVSGGWEILAAPLVTPAGTVRPREPGRRLPSRPARGHPGVPPRGPPGHGRIRRPTRGRGRGARASGRPRRPSDPARAGGHGHGAGAPSPRLWGPRRATGGAGGCSTITRGFPRRPVECDVVLPFHGHLPYVREALESILEQDSAEAIVHLIDDASPAGAGELLRYWGSHPRVRTYRNERNIGQFHSFNNVSPYFETALVAVQDGDDISRPDRLHRSGNLLRLADADIFGGRSQVFGEVPAELGGRRGPRRRRGPLFAWSRYPYTGAGFFLENPTAMFRVAAFEAVRGFADYGDLDRNKCGLRWLISSHVGSRAEMAARGRALGRPIRGTRPRPPRRAVRMIRSARSEGDRTPRLP